MINYLIEIEYEGTNFVGWQSQKNGKSVQDTIENVLKIIFKNKVRIIGAGRTDKGVHALSQYANFKVKKKIEDKNKFLNSVNYTEFKGWKDDLTKMTSADELPQNLMDYISFIEKETGVPVKIVSVGPDRKQTINR